MANSKARETGIAITKFIFWASKLSNEGGLVSLEPIEAEGAKLAAERITRQLAGAVAGGSVTGRPTGRNGGRPRVANPSPATLAQRLSRERRREK